MVGDANIRHYKKIPKVYVEIFNLEGLSFPLKFSQISKLVRKNKHIQMSIRVLLESENNLCILDTFSNRLNRKNKYENVLNLLMFKSDCRISLADKGSIDVKGFST